MGFKIATHQAVTIKNLIEILHNTFKIVFFNVRLEGIFIRMIDSRQSMLFDIELPSENFDEFKVDFPILFGINIMNFYDIISFLKKKDSIELEITDDQPNKLNVTIIPKDGDYCECINFTIQEAQVIDIELPVGYTSSISGPFSKFHKMCKEMSKICSAFRIQGNSSFISFAGSTTGVYGKRVVFGRESNKPLELDACFDLDNFLKFSKISNFGQDMHFYLKEKMPLLIQSNIGLLGKISIYVKPNSEESL
jgi:hypothetical protein